MWYLLAAVIGSSSLVIILKVFDLRRVDMYAGITVNYIVGALLAFAFAPVRLAPAQVAASPWLAVALVTGACFMLSFAVYALSAQVSGVAVTTISGRAAVVIPVAFAFLFLGERPTPLKLTMLALILLSMFLILKKKSDPSGGAAPARFTGLMLFLLPVAVFLFNGVNDTLVQFAQRERIPSESLYPVFNGVMFTAGAVTGAICWLVSRLRYRRRLHVRDLLWGSLLGFMNWICMTGVFNGLTYLDGSVFYPLYYTGAIVIATVAGVAIFHEKLSPLNYTGIGLAVAAIAVLSMA
ncbi:MAG: DMT family transporter [Alistipes sp.]|nr:DMT family transporter [Alistipes sp.]